MRFGSHCKRYRIFCNAYSKICRPTPGATVPFSPAATPFRFSLRGGGRSRFGRRNSRFWPCVQFFLAACPPPTIIQLCQSEIWWCGIIYATYRAGRAGMANLRRGYCRCRLTILTRPLMLQPCGSHVKSPVPAIRPWRLSASRRRPPPSPHVREPRRWACHGAGRSPRWR